MRVTLWEAIDRDRLRNRLGGVDRHLGVWGFAAASGLVVGPAIASAARSVLGALLGIALVTVAVGVPGSLLVMLMRRRRPDTSDAMWMAGALKMVPPSTASAMHSVSIAAGIPEPMIVRMLATGVNAVLYDMAGLPVLAVTDEFAELPSDQQEAGIAMLVARRAMGPPPPAMGFDEAPVTVWDPLDMRVQQLIYDSWTDHAAAGDREALLMLKHPGPFVRLLRRLSTTPSVVTVFPQLAEAYLCLAWPFTADEQTSGPMALVADRRRFDLLCSILPDGRAERELALMRRDSAVDSR
ncbi:MAG: hypothetical protein ACYC6C_06260 [Coriobacteriia bacterium]